MRLISRAVQTSRTYLARFSGVIIFFGAAAIAVTTLLVESGIASLRDPSPLVLLTIVAALVFLLRVDVSVSHQELNKKVTDDTQEIQAVTARIEDTQKEIDAAVGQQSANVRNMRETLENSGKLWSLESAIRDLEPRLNRIRKGQTIEIDHLGLNMHQAWEKLYPLIEKLAMDAHVSFQLLILGSRAAGGLELPGDSVLALPEDVETWAAAGDIRRKQIEKKLAEIQAKAGKPDGGSHSLSFAVRSYRDIPLVHGIRIRRPFHAAYMAIARWDDRQVDPFWWGGDQYHRILDPASADQVDLRDILDGYFRRWWMMNDPADRPQAA